MYRRPPEELLAELRTYLQHFDQTGHIGGSASIAEIQRRLRARIAEVEAQLKHGGPDNSAIAPNPQKLDTV